MSSDLDRASDLDAFEGILNGSIAGLGVWCLLALLWWWLRALLWWWLR